MSILAAIFGRRRHETWTPPLTPEERDRQALARRWSEARANLEAAGEEITHLTLDSHLWMVNHPEWRQPLTVEQAGREPAEYLRDVMLPYLRRK